MQIRHKDSDELLWVGDLYKGYFNGVDLRGAHLRGVDFTGANLRGAYLQGADLHGANLYKVDLRGVDFRDADLCGANLWDADIRGARFSNTDKFYHTPWDFCHIQKDNIRIGCQNHSTESWANAPDDIINSMDSDALAWWKLNKEVVLGIARSCDG